MSLGLLASCTVFVRPLPSVVLGQGFFPKTLNQSVLQSLTESRNDIMSFILYLTE